MKKSIGILLYLALMAVFLKFDLRLLFDLRQFLLVLFGTVLLLLPSLKEKEGQEGKGRMVSKDEVFFCGRGDEDWAECSLGRAFADACAVVFKYERHGSRDWRDADGRYLLPPDSLWVLHLDYPAGFRESRGKCRQ